MIDRDVAMRWNSIVFAMLTAVVMACTWLGGVVHLVAQAALDAMQRNRAELEKQVAEMHREIDILETRIAWEKRNQ